MDSCLVTGAAGFVGSNLVRELLDRGYHVRGFDNFETGRRENVAELAPVDAFEFQEGDLRNTDDVTAAVADVDAIFHQAAVPSVPRSVEDPVTSTEANCLGTSKLLDAARKSDVESVVVASSSSVYGSSTGVPKQESMPVDPESPYALSKFWTERLAMQFDDLYGMDAVALRYFNVFGPRQDPHSQYAAVVPKFTRLMLSGQRPTIYGDGEQTRDFTYIDNVVDANIRAATVAAHGEVCNIGCGDRISINDLVETLNDVLDSDFEPVYDSPRPGDVKHSQADISKARDLLGYEPSVDFRAGLDELVTHIRTSEMEG